MYDCKKCVRKKYIYAVGFANSMMEAGYKCLGTGFNARSQKFYWIFDKEEIQPFYMQQKTGGVMNDENSTQSADQRLT